MRRMGIPQKIGGELRLSFFNEHAGRDLEVTLESLISCAITVDNKVTFRLAHIYQIS